MYTEEKKGWYVIGRLAQMVERPLRMQEVLGSIPRSSNRNTGTAFGERPLCPHETSWRRRRMRLRFSIVSVPSESGSLCALIHYILHEKIQSCVCASPMSSCLNVSSIFQQRDEVIKDCRRLSKWVYIMMQKEIHVDVVST